MKKLLILILMTVFIPIAFGALGDNLVYYYNMSGNCDETIAGEDLTMSGLSTINGINGLALYNNGDDNDYCNNNHNYLSGWTDWTICFWYNMTTHIKNDHYFGSATALNADIAFDLKDSPNLRIYINGKTTNPEFTGAGLNAWHLWCAQGNTTGYRYTLNTAVAAFGSEDSKLPVGTDPITAFRQAAADGGITGGIDELMIWNRSLSQAEIVELYGGGTGLFYPFGAGGNTAPVIEVTPLTGVHDNKNLSIDAIVSDVDADDVNCVLFVNGTEKKRNGSVDLDVTFNLDIDDMVSDGLYTWFINCSDSLINTTRGPRDFILDTINPVINFIYPAADNSTEGSLYQISLNASVEDTYLDAINTTVYCEDNTQIYNNFSDDLQTPIHWVTDVVDFSSCGAGNHTVSIGARDSLSDSRKIIDKTDFEKVNNEVTLFKMDDGVIIEREFIIRDKLGVKVDSTTFELNTNDEWVDEGKHYKTTWEVKDLPKDGWFNIEMKAPVNYLKLKTDRGVTRIIDRNYNYYWRFDDLEQAGFTVEYDDKSNTTGVIELKVNLGSAGKINNKYILDPFVGGLNSVTKDVSYYIATKAADKWMTTAGLSYYIIYTSGDVYMTGAIKQTSPNGTLFNCRVTNAGAWVCS